MTALQAWWRTEHYRTPYLITTFGQVDRLIEALANAAHHRTAARLALHPSVRPYTEHGVPDHELIVGVNQAEDVGSLRLTTYDAVWYAQGKPPDDDQPVCYQLLYDRQEFPPDALLPLDDIRAAVKDFLVNSGRRRPINLSWIEWPRPEPHRLLHQRRQWP
jgi:Immunity protein Imm1